MNNSFIISTTSTLEGYKIESYLGPLIVPSIGAGSFIKDWFGRFTDFFGGRSESYRRTYEKILSAGLSEMSRQAKAHGASDFSDNQFHKARRRNTSKAYWRYVVEDLD